jgi:hypothetical protein
VLVLPGIVRGRAVARRPSQRGMRCRIASRWDFRHTRAVADMLSLQSSRTDRGRQEEVIAVTTSILSWRLPHAKIHLVSVCHPRGRVCVSVALVVLHAGSGDEGRCGAGLADVSTWDALRSLSLVRLMAAPGANEVLVCRCGGTMTDAGQTWLSCTSRGVLLTCVATSAMGTGSGQAWHLRRCQCSI